MEIKNLINLSHGWCSFPSIYGDFKHNSTNLIMILNSVIWGGSGRQEIFLREYNTLKNENCLSYLDSLPTKWQMPFTVLGWPIFLYWESKINIWLQETKVWWTFLITDVWLEVGMCFYSCSWADVAKEPQSYPPLKTHCCNSVLKTRALQVRVAVLMIFSVALRETSQKLKKCEGNKTMVSFGSWSLVV